MPVDSQHAEYRANLAKWKLVRDCVEGSEAVKVAGTTYLPMPNSEDQGAENKARYSAYVQRANYVNFTGHTKEGLTGLVFRKETTIEAPTGTEYLIDDANGGGLTADQMIKHVSGEVLALGRDGLLVDYPAAPAGLTVEQVSNLSLRANILSYPAESVINWDTAMYGGVKMLSLVVLFEPVEKRADDGFEATTEKGYRVLRLKIDENDNLLYVQNLYDEGGNQIVWEVDGVDDNGEKLHTGDIIPTKSDGSTWNEIPFIFVGSENNDERVDKAPLYDMAVVNIAHYRNSADYEESSFLVGQPTPVFSGLTQGWVDENMKDGIALGSRTSVLLPETGTAALLQADPNQMPSKGMEDKEAQMTKIGTRIIQDSTGTETAEAARIRNSGQNSKLSSIIINVEAAFEKCFAWAGEFMGATGEAEININKEFYDPSIDPQMVIAQIQLLDRGVIATNDLQNYLRRTGIIESGRTNEEIDSEAESADPLIGNV